MISPEAFFESMLSAVCDLRSRIIASTTNDDVEVGIDNHRLEEWIRYDLSDDPSGSINILLGQLREGLSIAVNLAGLESLGHMIVRHRGIYR